MQKVDIRKILVCEILKQNQVRQLRNNIGCNNHPSYTWDYDGEPSCGLFLKTIGGYKHITTGGIYQLASKDTGNKHVLNPYTIEELVKRERALCGHLINKYHSYMMDFSVIQALEERVASDYSLSIEDVSI